MRLAGLLSLCLAAPRLGAQAPPANGESWALFQGLHRCTRIDIQVPAGPCEQAALALAHALAGEFEVALDAADRDGSALRILIGSAYDPALLPLARACGVEPIEGGFCVLGRDYRARGDALVAVFEDPASRGRPICLVLGNDQDFVSVYLDHIPRLSRPYLWVYADGELALECPLAADGSPRAEEARDYSARRTRYFAAGRTFDFEGALVHVRNGPTREQWRAYAVGLAGARRRTLGWFGIEQPPVVDLYVYEHLEDLEECVGASALSVCNRLRPRVHLLLAPGMPDDGGAGLARVLAQAAAGAPAAAWLADGLAVAAAGQWWQRPLDEWIGQLAAGRLLPPWEEVRRAEAGARFSEHLLAPARGLLFEQLVFGLDPGRVRALWKGALPEPRRVATLYQRGLQAAQQAAGVAPARRHTEAGGPDARAPFLHGLALVEGVGAAYSSSLVDETLAEGRALQPGPDAVSLTVFASPDEPEPPLSAALRRPAHGSTSDLGLASASAAAHAQGMRVLLALEVLAQPSGAWADVLAWASPEDRWLFWERYERVALHYALLAELAGVEHFSFGSNLRETTRTEVDVKSAVKDPVATEQAEQRRVSWQNLILRLRKAYGGGLTYAARFPAEAREVGFFDRLDHLGLLLYPRLPRAKGAPDDEVLRRALRFELQQALDLAVRWNKPLVLVQLGFPARADSWALPMVPRGAPDLDAQQRYFEALADVLCGKDGLAAELENAAALGGFFLWNWPLDEQWAGPRDAGFSLRQKPVESALRRLFAR